VEGYVGLTIDSGVGSYFVNFDTKYYVRAQPSSNLGLGLVALISNSWNNINGSASGSSCGISSLGYPYDPNLACVSSSVSKYCSILNKNRTSYACTPAEYQAGQYANCAVGDLTGKFGVLMAPNFPGTSVSTLQFVAPPGVLRDFQPPYVADYMKNGLITPMWSSIVFYSAVDLSPQFCAKFTYVPAGKWSVCGFPSPSNPGNNLSNGLTNTGISIVVLCSCFAAYIVFTIFMYVMGYCNRPDEEVDDSPSRPINDGVI
jgi:hypothetical protein